VIQYEIALDSESSDEDGQRQVRSCWSACEKQAVQSHEYMWEEAPPP
jgi:hypothetical protein